MVWILILWVIYGLCGYITFVNSWIVSSLLSVEKLKILQFKSTFINVLSTNPLDTKQRNKITMLSLNPFHTSPRNKILLLNSFMTEAVSYTNQSIDMQSKSMDWFLYDGDLRHERVNSIQANVLFPYGLKTFEKQKIFNIFM